MDFNYEMGVGHSEPVPHLPGAVYKEFTEEGARAFYRQWGRFMDGWSWDRLRPGAARHEEAAA
jgi:hypothetical protein